MNLQAPLLIRRADTREPQPFREHMTQNISLAGVYFEAEDADTCAVNEVVIASVSIPEPQRRTFPFTRLAGRSRVVRVKEFPSETAAGGRKRFGVALEFGNDLTALAALPPRG